MGRKQAIRLDALRQPDGVVRALAAGAGADSGWAGGEAVGLEAAGEGRVVAGRPDCEAVTFLVRIKEAIEGPTRLLIDL